MKTASIVLWVIATCLSFPTNLFSQETPSPQKRPLPNAFSKEVFNYCIKALNDLGGRIGYQSALGECGNLMRITNNLDKSPQTPVVQTPAASPSSQDQDQDQDKDIKKLAEFCRNLVRAKLIGPQGHNDAPQAYYYYDQLCDRPELNPKPKNLDELCAEVRQTNSLELNLNKTLPSTYFQDLCVKLGQQASPDQEHATNPAMASGQRTIIIKADLNNGNAPSSNPQAITNNWAMAKLNN